MCTIPFSFIFHAELDIALVFLVAFQETSFRFVDLYGDITPKLAEEDKKIFDLWMENWIEQRQSDFLYKFRRGNERRFSIIDNNCEVFPIPT